MQLLGFYSDGTSEAETSCYIVEGFNSAEVGKSFVTVTKHGVAAKQHFVFNGRVDPTNPNGSAWVPIKGFTVTIIDAAGQELFFDYGLKRSEEVTQPDGYTVPLGRTLVLAPVKWFIPDGTVFEWKVGNDVTQSSTSEYFSFTPTAQGNYAVMVTAKINGTAVASASTTVACVAPEGTYKRPLTGDSSYKSVRTAFGLAPGQFTEPPKSTDPNATLLGTGGFGGYSIFAFDHSIERQGIDGLELTIQGNAFGGWHEQGTVWVMQDENGNGLPDDTWYELIGTKTLEPETLRRYSVTYRKDGSWISNVGGSGTIGPLMRYRSTADWKTYTNTRLVDNSWRNPNAWGYVDSDARFSISDAIQVNGDPITLVYIDFVRVATALSFSFWRNILGIPITHG